MARLSKILGPDGRPVDLDELFGEPRAAPTLTGVRSPISGHPADGLTPSRLAAIHRAAAQGDPLAYLELAEDIEERDLHYAAVLGTRKRQVAQLPINVEAASDDPEHIKHADFIREWINEGVLDAALFDLFDAVGKGFSILEIEWSSTPERIEPLALNYRPQRWFEFDDVSLDEPMLRELATKQPLAPHRFVVHRHKSKSGLTIRSGLARVASWAWMYKAFTLRDWAVFVQNYGAPIRVGRYDQSASEAEKEVLWRAVGNIAGDCAAIIPKSMEIQFVELKNAATNAEVYEKRADWMDRQISKLVLGQTATTDAIAGGHAVGQEHRLVQEDLERSDAKLGSNTVTRQIARPMIAFNFGPQAKYPKVVIGRPDELPVEKLVDAVYKLGSLGLTVEASQIRDRLGVTEAAKGAEVVGGRPAAPAPGGTPAGNASAHASTLKGLLQLQARQDPDLVDRLTERLALDARGALAGMVEEVRRVFEQAPDLQSAAAALAKLDLSPDAFALAMGQGMTLAHLVGQASLIDQIRED
jgi:phage gp29-like protein